jgi:hypothetical protein
LAKVAIIFLLAWQSANAQSGKETNRPVSSNDAERSAQMNDHQSIQAGHLSGLRGEGGFEGYFGKGSDGTLDYWFE